jgi:hypothetical protein
LGRGGCVHTEGSSYTHAVTQPGADGNGRAPDRIIADAN